jgi:hypothetical protein
MTEMHVPLILATNPLETVSTLQSLVLAHLEALDPVMQLLDNVHTILLADLLLIANLDKFVTPKKDAMFQLNKKHLIPKKILFK